MINGVGVVVLRPRSIFWDTRFGDAHRFKACMRFNRASSFSTVSRTGSSVGAGAVKQRPFARTRHTTLSVDESIRNDKSLRSNAHFTIEVDAFGDRSIRSNNMSKFEMVNRNRPPSSPDIHETVSLKVSVHE
jgi:hypothetical protein